MGFCTKSMDKDLQISTGMVYSDFSKYRIIINKLFHKVNPKQMEANGKNFISNVSHARRTKLNIGLHN